MHQENNKFFFFAWAFDLLFFAALKACHVLFKMPTAPAEKTSLDQLFFW